MQAFLLDPFRWGCWGLNLGLWFCQTLKMAVFRNGEEYFSYSGHPAVDVKTTIHQQKITKWGFHHTPPALAGIKKSDIIFQGFNKDLGLCNHHLAQVLIVLPDLEKWHCHQLLLLWVVSVLFKITSEFCVIESHLVSRYCPRHFLAFQYIWFLGLISYRRPSLGKSWWLAGFERGRSWDGHRCHWDHVSFKRESCTCTPSH